MRLCPTPAIEYDALEGRRVSKHLVDTRELSKYVKVRDVELFKKYLSLLVIHLVICFMRILKLKN